MLLLITSSQRTLGFTLRRARLTSIPFGGISSDGWGTADLGNHFVVGGWLGTAGSNIITHTQAPSTREPVVFDSMLAVITCISCIVSFQQS